MKKTKSLIIIFTSLLLAFSVISCKQNDTIDLPSDSEISESEPVISETENIQEEEKEPEKAIEFKNKLTGLETTEFLSNQRPVAIMYNNIRAALPQVGISNADILYEITVEGAITRLMGVTTDWAALPTVGSVRSSRDYFIDISDAHNAIYVHAGGSDIAYNILWTRKTDRIDGTNGGYASGQAFYYDPERRKTMSIEHTYVTNGEKLATAIAKNNYPTTYKDGYEAPYSFADREFEIDGNIADYVYIPFSYYAQAYLDYNAETKLYMKGQYLNSKNSLDKHDSPHIDGNTGEQLAFKNVIVLTAKHSAVAGDTKGRISVDFTGEGKGYYITNGKSMPIVWKKASRTSNFTLYEDDGTTELVINPGKSYVAIAPTDANITIK